MNAKIKVKLNGPNSNGSYYVASINGAISVPGAMTQVDPGGFLSRLSVEKLIQNRRYDVTITPAKI